MIMIAPVPLLTWVWSFFSDCLLDVFQKLPTARPIISSYLRECLLQDLISARQVLQSALARRRAMPGDMDTGDADLFSGNDLESICDAIVTGLPPAMSADMLSKESPAVPSSSSLAELVHILTALLPDITEDHPTLSQVFTSLLSTIPSIESLSEDDREAVALLRSKSRDMASISKAAVQELNLLASSSGVEAPRVEGLPRLQVTVHTEGEESDPSPPVSPDPWSTAEPRPAVNGVPNDIKRIEAPPYITFLVQDALHSLCTPIQRTQTSTENASSEVPVSYKRIVHAAPEVSSRPLNFIYHLLCTSFGLLAASIDDFQERAVREEQQSTSMMDSADEVMLNLNGGSSSEMSDNLKYAKIKELIARDGWKEWMWCFSGLLDVLRYWKSMRQGSSIGVFAGSWQLPVSNASKLYT